MKKCTLLLAMLILSIQVSLAEGFNVLVFSKTAAFRHADAIGAGNAMFSNVAASNGWNVEFTESSADFTKVNLSQYDAIVWNNVSGNVLNPSERDAFKSFINEGGGYVGIHNAADAETNWPWYVDLMGGATFLNHAAGGDQIQSVSIDLESTSDSITSHFGSSFKRIDEWYNFRSNPRSFVDVLLSIDESTLSGPNMGGDHPITWKHEYDGGRVFYTGFGHTSSSFSESGVVTMLTEAVKWVATEKNSIILDEFNGTTEPGQWTVQAPYNGTFPFTASINKLELTGIEPGPNQHLVREGVTIDPFLPYTVETKFKILNYGGVKSFAVNFLQDNQPASERINSWTLNLDLGGPVIKYMGFVNGSFDQIGSRPAPWAVQNQEYIYKIEVNRRLNGDISPKWVTATISKPDGTIMDNFEVDYSKFRWQPNLNESAKFGLNSHFASWVASNLKIFYSGKSPNTKEEILQSPQKEEEQQLIGYWPFDGDADDVSGNQNHGTEYNNPFYPTAYVSKGLEANGAFTSVNSDPFDASTFTLMSWIKPDDVSGSFRTIIEKDKHKSDWYGLYQLGNKIHVRWSLTGTTTAASVALEPNVFTHVAATFDGSSARIYINGVLKHTVSGSPSKPSADDGELRIGIDGIGAEAYQGIIDEAKIFKGALSQSKIQLEMDSSTTDVSNTPEPTSTPTEVPVEEEVIVPTPTPIATPRPTSTPTPIATPRPTSTPAPISSPTVPSTDDPEITLAATYFKLASLKSASWDQIGDYAVRVTVDGRLAQAKNYFNIAVANFNNGKEINGSRYLKVCISNIKKFISIIEKGVNENKLIETVAQPLLNEAISIKKDINVFINGEPIQPIVTPTPVPTAAPTPTPLSSNPTITLSSVASQIASLKSASWSQVGDYAVRITIDGRLAQAKNYFNIATANLKNGGGTNGATYLKICMSYMQQFITTLDKGINDNKLAETVVLPLMTEANSIRTNINVLIDG